MDLARLFAQLASCRSVGAGGIGPIPITALWQWQDRNDVTDPMLRRHIEDVIANVEAIMFRKRKQTPERPEKSTAPRRRSR